jgi:hypothetical protein
MGKGRRNKHPRNKSSPSVPAISNAVEHVMLEPRLLACLTVLGLGAGFGVGLMLAKVLTYTGFAIALACAALSIWIYVKPIREIARAVTSRTSYKGPPSLREIAISLGLTVALVITASSVLPISLSEPPNLHKAVAQLKLIEAAKLPESSPVRTIWAHFNNAGDLDATDFGGLATGRVTTQLLTSDQITTQLDAMEKALKIGDAAERSNLQTVLNRNQDQLVTLQDVTADQFADVLHLKRVPPTIEYTDAQWGDFMKGSTQLYLFYVANYRDESLKKGEHWRLRFCGYFVASTTFWHNCSTNSPQKISFN